jgi:hypothetical protein
MSSIFFLKISGARNEECILSKLAHKYEYGIKPFALGEFSDKIHHDYFKWLKGNGNWLKWSIGKMSCVLDFLANGTSGDVGSNFLGHARPVEQA